jgi:hypothetical protein
MSGARRFYRRFFGEEPPLAGMIPLLGFPVQTVSGAR